MAKKKSIVTNAMRIVAAEKIPFEAVEYEAESVGEHFGVAISEMTGIPCDMCYKTLVAKGKDYMVICIPVDREVDLKKIAEVSKNKKVEMLPTKELLGITGYIRGGVSPIGMKKKYQTYIEETCKNHEKIAISGGVCGLSLLMSPNDLISLTKAIPCEIVKE